ncbi:MAG: VanZ family protein [Anaerolineaceae bacterium]|nr:VanZ family protein [Anaerolineaceae bacterium]
MLYKNLKHWIPVLLWILLISLFSAVPTTFSFLPESWRSLLPLQWLRALQEMITEHSFKDLYRLVLSFVEYSVLIFWLTRAVDASFPANPKNYGFVLLFSMLYALSNKLYQLSIQGGPFQIMDLINELFGVIFAFLVLKKISNQKNKSLDNMVSTNS